MESLKNNYLFTSERLGFRNWTKADRLKLAEINADPKVMEYFPSILTFKETSAFIDKMSKQCEEKGYCYFAVELLENAKLIGMIGISDKDFASDFTPCVDIGWRLAQTAWGKGYATEGAKRCLEYAFEVLGIDSVKAIAPSVNVKSELVMKKIGMKKVKHFDHPQLLKNERLKDCVLYEINKPLF